MRSLKKQVRLLRVPDETHELTRSGTPFRRVENLEIVESWFRHFLIDGKRGLPPLPKVRAGRWSGLPRPEAPSRLMPIGGITASVLMGSCIRQVGQAPSSPERSLSSISHAWSSVW